jgi:hypothetical protein
VQFLHCCHFYATGAPHISAASENNINKGGGQMKTNKTDLYVTGLGAAVTAIGATALSGAAAYAAMGFGTAHIVLGVLDMYRQQNHMK